MATGYISKWREIEKTRNIVVWETTNRKGNDTDNANILKIINMDNQEYAFHLHMYSMNRHLMKVEA